MRLDQSMRARLRALSGRARSPALNAPVRRTEQAAGSAHGVEQRRRELIIHGLSLACAAALVFFVIVSLEGDAPVVPRPVARRQHALVPPATPSPSMGAARAALSSAGSRACAGEATLTFSLEGQRRLDLGARALMVANHGAVLAATQTADCDLRVGLADGSLAVHAGDLQGRALVVNTSRGDIRVKGTVFLVDFYAASGELEVGVEEGVVELVTTQGQRVVLEAGHAAYLGRHLELEPFDDSGRARVRRMLGLEGKRARTREPRADAPDQTPGRDEAPARARRTEAASSGEEPELGPTTTEVDRTLAKPKRKRRSDAREADEQPPAAQE